MRILLIGDKCLHNDSIKKILSLQNNWQVDQLTLSEIEESDFKIDGKFSLCLIDWSSCRDNIKERIDRIRQIKTSALGVIFHSESEELMEEIEHHDIDGYLSMGWESDKFIRTIEKLGNSQ